MMKVAFPYAPEHVAAWKALYPGAPPLGHFVYLTLDGPTIQMVMSPISVNAFEKLQGYGKTVSEILEKGLFKNERECVVTCDGMGRECRVVANINGTPGSCVWESHQAYLTCSFANLVQGRFYLKQSTTGPKYTRLIEIPPGSSVKSVNELSDKDTIAKFKIENRSSNEIVISARWHDFPVWALKRPELRLLFAVMMQGVAAALQMRNLVPKVKPVI